MPLSNADVTYYDYLAQHPDANIRVAALTDEASLVCFPFRKVEDTTLVDAVNQALKELMDEGKIAELSH